VLALPVLLATASVVEIDANALPFASVTEIVARPLMSGEIAAMLCS
jgi:hypothetical protein